MNNADHPQDDPLTVLKNNIMRNIYMKISLCVSVCAHTHARAGACVCMRACVQAKSTHQHISNKFSLEGNNELVVAMNIVMEDPDVNQRIMLIPLYTRGTIEKLGEIVNYLISLT